MNTFVIILHILAYFVGVMLSYVVLMLLGSFIVGLIWTASFKGAVGALKEMLDALPALMILLCCVYGVGTVITFTLCYIYR